MRGVLADFLMWFLRLTTQIFFRRIEVSGREHVPKTGPIVIVGNHPNSLLDPVLVATTSGRRVSFAAKAPLFRGPMRPFLWAMHAVPIHRRQDAVEGVAEDATDLKSAPERVDNSAAFDALTAVLKDGAAFAIFPEGISHTRPELAPLKSGAARIVLAAAADGVPVQIVPCGLNYRRRDRLRSRVLVQYGKPIVVDGAFLHAWREDQHKAAKALTATINIALRGQTINASDFETLRVLDGVKALYRPRGHALSLAEEAELVRRFLDHWARKQDVPALRHLYDDIDLYLAELRALSLSDSELTNSFSWWDKVARVVRQVFFLAVLVPFAIPGIILHAPVLLAAVAASRTLTDRGDVRATIQMAVVTACTLLTWAAIGVVAFFSQDTVVAGVAVAVAVVGGLVISGLATLRVLDGEGAVRRGLWTLLALVQLDEEMERLRARRDSLRARLLIVVSEHIDDGLRRVVDSSEHADGDPWLDDDDAH